MAKSLRSKWKRKQKAVKRERYAVKELDRLKTMLKNQPKIKPIDTAVVNVIEPSELKKRRRRRTRRNEIQTATTSTASESGVESMEVEGQTPSSRKYNRKLLDEHGNYPSWMNPRKIKKMTSSKKGKKKKKGGQSTW